MAAHPAQVLRQAACGAHAAAAASAAALEGLPGSSSRLSQPIHSFYRLLSSKAPFTASPPTQPAAEAATAAAADGGVHASCTCSATPATPSTSTPRPASHTSHTSHISRPWQFTPPALPAAAQQSLGRSLASLAPSRSPSLSCAAPPPSSLPASYQALRAYAKKATAGGGGAAAAPQPKRVRRSATRLFSCRNDRFRSTFEQIWPTLRLTADEAQLFKRNSRFFVIETGKTLSLKNKFDLSRPSTSSTSSPSSPLGAAAPPALKPHYADARVGLFESQLHLDAIGEQPRYLKIRRIRTQFGIRLQNIRKVRLLLGFERRGYLQRLYELAQVQPGTNKVWKLICALESRLSLFALRMGLAPDAIEARKLLNNKVHVNGAPPELTHAYVTQLGDVLTPAPSERPAFRDNLSVAMGSLMYDVHRDHLQL